MRRRDIVKALGAAILTRPIHARAQAARSPVVGVLSASSDSAFEGADPAFFSSFHRGLSQIGYIEGQNLTIERRRADGRIGLLSELAAALVRLQVAAIATHGGNAAARAAKSLTSTIPIVFTTGDDPVETGLVASLNRPGGNVTGVTVSSTELIGKQLELLRELLPTAATVATLVGGDRRPAFWNDNAAMAARRTGFRTIVISVAADGDLDAALTSAKDQGADALLFSAAPLFMRRRARLVALAAHHGLPAIYSWRQFCDAGGLMSYGADLLVSYVETGIYVGRVLNGTPPGDLPVQLPSKFELVINLKTARALGITTLPRLLNARVDKVIE